MPAQLLDGTKCANFIYEKIKRQCLPQWPAFPECDSAPKEPSCAPTLAILITDVPASRISARNKMNKCAEVGITCLTASVPEHDHNRARDILCRWATDNTVDGIIIEQPSAFSDLQHMIPPEKDVSGVMIDAEFDPCIPRGIMHLLHSTNVDLADKHAVVISQSNNIGRSMAQMLLDADCAVTICHSQTENLAKYTRMADILICAADRPYTITADMVKPGVIIIDAGMNHVSDPENPGKTKLAGDVDFEHVKELASWITPVPGGIGPIATAVLLDNVYQANVDAAWHHFAFSKAF